MVKVTLNTETFFVPLDKLERDPGNVRLSNQDVEVPELAHNIAHEGLLHGLGVRPILNDNGEPTGRYGVVIGGRRWLALKLLAKKKRLAKDEPVPCYRVKPEAATSAGMAENLQRVAMHPADQYINFARMSDEGLSDAEIAVRFGIAPTTVQKRLRLGRLSPHLLDALRTNRISEQVAQAFAITTDTEAQERVYAKVQGGWINPRTVRELLTEGEVPSHDRRVTFVGLNVYEQAGGNLRRDLFAEDEGGGVTLTDPGLLDRLVLEKLAMEGDKLRTDGWRDVSVSVSSPDDLRSFYPAPCEHEPLSEDAEQRLTTLSAEYDTLEEKGEAGDLTDEDEERLEAIEAERTAIETAAERYDDDIKATGKAFVYLDYTGLRVMRGVPRVGQTQTLGEAEADDDSDEHGGADRLSTSDHPVIEKPQLSAALAADLQAHRTAALQAVVAQTPDLALRLVVHSLLLDRQHARYRAVAKISGYEPNLKQVCPTIEDTPAVRVVTEMHDQRGFHEPGEHAELLPWLLNLDNSEVLTILAPLVASTINAGCEDWSRGPGCSLAAQVATAARLNMADWWTATEETYFSRVTKVQIGQAVREAGAGPFNAEGKKADVASAAARLVADTGWLPAMLRSPPSDVTDTTSDND
jgi:ParB family chromosome partitioning protein